MQKSVFEMWQADFCAQVFLSGINLGWQKHAKTIQALLYGLLAIIPTFPKTTIAQKCDGKADGNQGGNSCGLHCEALPFS